MSDLSLPGCIGSLFDTQICYRVRKHLDVQKKQILLKCNGVFIAIQIAIKMVCSVGNADYQEVKVDYQVVSSLHGPFNHQCHVSVYTI